MACLRFGTGSGVRMPITRRPKNSDTPAEVKAERWTCSVKTGSQQRSGWRASSATTRRPQIIVPLSCCAGGTALSKRCCGRALGIPLTTSPSHCDMMFVRCPRCGLPYGTLAALWGRKFDTKKSQMFTT